MEGLLAVVGLEMTTEGIRTGTRYRLGQSCPWVALTHRLGWVESGWVEIFQLLVGWVGSTIA